MFKRTNKRLQLLAAVIILPFFISGCAFLFRPKASSKNLWKHIKKSRPYIEYAFIPGKEGLYHPEKPHGFWMQTFINEEAFESIEEKREVFKDGSIIVSENYSKEKELSFILAMYKVKGYNPQNGDWFWAQFDITGEPIKEAKPVQCISCHSEKKDKDYIFRNTLQ